jgi:natural product precursor
MKTIKKINLNGLDKEKVMSSSEMKHVKGGSYMGCYFEGYGCFLTFSCGDCISSGGSCGGFGYC